MYGYYASSPVLCQLIIIIPPCSSLIRDAFEISSKDYIKEPTRSNRVRWVWESRRNPPSPLFGGESPSLVSLFFLVTYTFPGKLKKCVLYPLLGYKRSLCNQSGIGDYVTMLGRVRHPHCPFRFYMNMLIFNFYIVSLQL